MMIVLQPVRFAVVQPKAALAAAVGRRSSSMPFVDAVQNESPSSVAAERALFPPMPEGTDAAVAERVDVSHEPSAAQTPIVKGSAVPGATVSLWSLA